MALLLRSASASGKTTVAMGAAAGESLQTIAVKSSNKLQSNRRTQVLTSNKCRIDLHLNKICQKLTICWYTWSFNFLLRRMLQIHILFAGWLNMIQNSGKFTSIPSAQGPNIVDGLLKMHGISTSKNATKQSTKKFNGCTHSSRLLHPKNKPLRGPLRARHYGINLSQRASARWIFFVPGRDLLVVGVWSFRPPLKVEDRLIEVGIRGKESWFKETCNRT